MYIYWIFVNWLIYTLNCYSKFTTGLLTMDITWCWFLHQEPGQYISENIIILLYSVYILAMVRWTCMLLYRNVNRITSRSCLHPWYPCLSATILPKRKFVYEFRVVKERVLTGIHCALGGNILSEVVVENRCLKLSIKILSAFAVILLD